MSQAIHCGIYNCMNPSDVRECRTVYCECAETCSLYKRGQCAGIVGLFAGTCPFSEHGEERGYSKRAAKYYEWEKDVQSRPYYNKLSKPNNYIGRVGNYLISDMYCGIYWNELERRWDGPTMFRTPISKVPVAELTSEALNKLYCYTPCAIFGGAIKDLKKSRDAWFTMLQETFPQQLEDFVREYGIELSANHIGRYAFVYSLEDGTVLKHNGAVFVKQGNKLFCENYPYIGSVFSTKPKCHLTCDINMDMKVKVESESMVNKNTVYSD